MTDVQHGELLTVAKALRVLRAFTDERLERGVTELAAELDLDKAGVHRLLTTLANQGFVQVDPLTRRYSLGPSLVVLGQRAEQSHGLQQVAEPHLEQLAAAAGESAVLCVPGGLRYRTVASAAGPGLVRFATSLGKAYPGHRGATGHAIYALLPNVATVDLLAAAGFDEPMTLAELESRHQHVRDHGYSITFGEFDPRVMAVAAPVIVDGSVFGAVASLGPAEYMKHQRDLIVPAVLTAAADLGQSLRG